MLGQQDK